MFRENSIGCISVVKNFFLFLFIVSPSFPASSQICFGIFKKNQAAGKNIKSLTHPLDTENAIQKRGVDIIKGMGRSSLFPSGVFQNKIMESAMKDDHFRIKLLHFIYTLPTLKTDQEVIGHWKEYFEESTGEISTLSSFGIKMGGFLSPRHMAQLIKKSTEKIALLFIGGSDVHSVRPVLEESRKRNQTFSLDILGEAVLSEKEASEFLQNYKSILKNLVEMSKNWEENPQIDRDSNGPIPSVHLSLKLSSLSPKINEKAWSQTVKELQDRLRPIFAMAKENFVSIVIDMEQYHHKDLTQEVFKNIIMEPQFKNYPHFGIVLQAYLKDSFDDAVEFINFAKKRKTPFHIRLVKGAYWDQEIITAHEKGWDIPVFQNKAETDRNYEMLAKELFKNGYPHIRLALASHNVRSLSAGLVFAEEFKIPRNDLEIQMLYGMGDPIKKSLIKEGYRVREYIPVGEILPGISYLVRRLLENTANNSFVRALFNSKDSAEKLLADPGVFLQSSREDFSQKSENSYFQNEPPLDWTKKENREKMKAALKKVRRDFEKIYPLFINGKKAETKQFLTSLNPSDHSVVGYVEQAGIKEADTAVFSAKMAFQSWSQTPLKIRIKKMHQLADEILKKRFELMALEVFEVGKTWSEADGDIIEAVDFIRYYSREMEKLGTAQNMSPHIPGEKNVYEYRAKGVALVIAPWNFPLAILTGMTVAPLLAGNTVVVKPAEQSAVMGAQLMKIMEEVGFPKGVVNFVPGLGEEVGDHLVNHRDISIVNFTGSQKVGLGIIKKTAEVKGSTIKKVVTELGGKNTIVIDSDADLDQAVGGVLHSVFGFQGQKCSACSRVLVLKSVYDVFLERFVEAAKHLSVRPPENPDSDMGPVIDKEAFERIQKTISFFNSDDFIAYKGGIDKQYERGYFIPPVILKNMKLDSTPVQEEIFGPVVVVIEVEDINTAISIANEGVYGLTGGIYSRTPSHIKKIKEELRVGNLYINKPITGSIVGRQPFGGLKLSGSGGKAGGPDYLLNFLDAVAVSDAEIIKLAPVE